jgi:cyclomaltodextrinase / maltogenic alpha-amylase / neopullulanase
MVRLSIATLFLCAMTTVHAQLPAPRLSLDGEWFFSTDTSKSGIVRQWFADSAGRSTWTRVQAPAPWETYPGLSNFDGWGWFYRTFSLESVSEPLTLHFAGVDDDAVVWVNGMCIGEHAGWTDPFALDASRALRRGTNSIAILVKDYAGGGGLVGPVTLIAARSLDELEKSPYYGTPALKSADWVKDATIYSVYLRSASPEGTFGGFEKRLPELKAMGVTVLWFLPIHPVGLKERKGSLGSPYAVQDYEGINPEFGTMLDFKRLLASAHRLGLKVIIDLVANHTSWDSKLILQHPEWFTHDASGKIIPPNADWTDVADLDYSQPGLRKYMIGMMRWWVKDIGIDGFRCDVAEMVPTDFWNDARASLNKVKPVMMLAEGSIPELHAKAFDLTYAWNVYDILQAMLEGRKPVTLLDNALRNERLRFPAGSLRMRFTTNHDKNAWDAPATKKFGHDGLRLATILVNTLPGVPLLYTGEEVENDRVLGLFEKVPVDWNRSREMGDLWKKLFALRVEHKSLSRGEMVRLNVSPDSSVFGFARAAGADRAVSILNFSSEPKTVTLAFPMDRLFAGQRVVVLKDALSGAILTLDKQGVASVTIPGRGGWLMFPEVKRGK